MANPVYDLDQDIAEYFEFKIQGNLYRFRYLTAEEMEKVGTALEKDPKKLNEFFQSFITKVDEKSPDFSEISKKMLMPQLVKFNEMIKAEFGAT